MKLGYNKKDIDYALKNKLITKKEAKFLYKRVRENEE